MSFQHTPPSPTAVARSRGRRVADTGIARLLKLPPPTTDYTRTSDLRIPMRDGAILLADHLAPIGEHRGTVLSRSPYGFNVLGTLAFGGMLARHGYHVVLARTRGTFGSGGDFEPFGREVEDAVDTVKWLREQPFFAGRFATFVGSYLAFTQWALLMDPPPELATSVMQVSPHDISRAIYANGALNLDDFLGWSNQVTRQEEGSLLSAPIRGAVHRRRQGRVNAALPLAEANDTLLQGRAPWYGDWLARRDLDDPYWARMQLGAALDRVGVPVLL